MVEGFSLDLQYYCSHCGEFEADVYKTDYTSFSDGARKYMTSIKCENANKCARVKENLEKKLRGGL